jgi:thiol:disulfide interchange protein DsbA
MKRREFNQTLVSSLAGASFLSSPLLAQAQGGPTEGVDFKRLDPPQATNSPGKIEVLEFFSYACPACFRLEPYLHNWAGKQAADVALRRVPVSFLMNAANFQRTYYSLEAMGAVETLQLKIFEAVHIQRQRLGKAEEIAEVVSKAGGDGAKFLQMFNSFSVSSKAGQAERIVQAYRLDGVPALAVQGRWMTSPVQAKGEAQALAVVDHLVQRVRSGAKS